MNFKGGYTYSFLLFCGGSAEKRGKIVSERAFVAFGDFNLARHGGGLESPGLFVIPCYLSRELGGRELETGTWGRELRTGNWGQGTWDRELGAGN